MFAFRSPHRCSIGSLVLLVCGGGLASQGAVHSPKWLAKTEGSTFCKDFGGWPAMRYQMLDGEIRGTPATIKDVSLRLDHHLHSSFSTTIGRTWPKVTLHIADSDVTAASKDFAKNMTSPPTLVFDGKITWPDFNGSPLTRPALWGGVSGDYRFPFQAGWSYSGQKDIALDWNFSGGTLIRGGLWDRSPKPYWFDSFGDPDDPARGTYRFLPTTRLNNNSPSVTSRCNDSFFGSTNTGARASMFIRVYGPSATDPNLRDQAVLWSTSRFSAPGSAVIHAWAFVTHDSGVDMNTGCNRLHAVGPTLFFTHTTLPASVDPTGYSGIRMTRTTWFRGLSSARITAQAGWADSVTKELRLSQAHEATFPGDKPRKAPSRAAIYEHRYAPVFGPNVGYRYNPVLRYGR